MRANYNPRLKELGITVLRFHDEDVMKSIDGVMRVIQCFIEDFEEKHKTHPSVPS